MTRGALAFFVLIIALASAGIELHDYGRFCRMNPDRAPIAVRPEQRKAAAFIGKSPTHIFCSDQTGLVFDRRAYAMQLAALPSVSRLIGSRYVDLIAEGLAAGEVVVMDSLPRERIAELRRELGDRDVPHRELVIAPDLVLLLPEAGT